MKTINLAFTIVASFFIFGAKAATEYSYSKEDFIVDVRGGATLKITYPPSLIDSIGSHGKLKVSLGNFGHI